MTHSARFPFLAIALALPSPLMAQAVQDFSLPPAPTPSASPRAQGPIDEESGPVPARPRVIGTQAPTAIPTPSPTPAEPTPVDEDVLAASPRESTITARPQPRPTAAEPQAALPNADADVGSTASAEVAAPAEAATVPVAPAIGASEAADSPATFDWRWAAGVGAALLAALGGLLIWRRRRAKAAPPVIERPIVRTAVEPQIVPAAQALSIRCEAEKLTRSAAYATLKYRLTLVNRTDLPLTDVAIGLDLASAHAGAPMEDQVATTGTALDIRHTLARIAPHQTVTVEGQVQLPLATAQVVLQGRHPLLVPLLRVRVDGAGEGVLVKTFVVGQGSPDGGRVQPFRLDEPPRSYAPLAHRELA
ncbi:hypothetical protein [Erythrobacter mangrovi]|uniref:LPXTG cell wall anchor domain-containing protein n=1 Tax=Erythrobacter mangrovi TaxID=2739433 RepID=A0A7D4ASF1_9SPHN|nr:hypothetical protein [Erythrobacter mangrovi]QKG70117.1 hypothetical protein HQR01_01330 [Erythrobacter mangrovi]